MVILRKRALHPRVKKKRDKLRKTVLYRQQEKNCKKWIILSKEEKLQKTGLYPLAGQHNMRSFLAANSTQN